MSEYNRRERAGSRSQPYPLSEDPYSYPNTSPTRTRRDSREQPLVLQSRNSRSDSQSGARTRDSEYDDYPHEERREVEVAKGKKSYSTGESRSRSSKYSTAGPGNRRSSDSPRTSRYPDRESRDVKDGYHDEWNRGTSQYFQEPESRGGTDYDMTSSPTSLTGGGGRWDPLESERGTVHDDPRDEHERSRRSTGSRTTRAYPSQQQGTGSFRLTGSRRLSQSLVIDAARSLLGKGESVRLGEDPSSGDFIVMLDRNSTLTEAQLWQECSHRERQYRSDVPRSRTGSGPYLTDDKHEPRDPPRSSNFGDRQPSNIDTERTRSSRSTQDDRPRRRYDDGSSISSSYSSSERGGFSSRSSHTTAPSSEQDFDYRSSGRRQGSIYSSMGQGASGASVFPPRGERMRSPSFADSSMRPRQGGFGADPGGTGRFGSADDNESDPEWGKTPMLRDPADEPDSGWDRTPMMRRPKDDYRR